MQDSKSILFYYLSDLEYIVEVKLIVLYVVSEEVK